uniref:Uncharacterized protein n=1 Tax=Acrobeloides nanus TaxID=290746 RepID=A0A914D6U3_9BILA
MECMANQRKFKSNTGKSSEEMQKCHQGRQFTTSGFRLSQLSSDPFGPGLRSLVDTPGFEDFLLPVVNCLP